MRDLASDTRISGRDGLYSATLHAGWDIWGPQGGYVAGAALRAAAAETAFRRPASFACHFLRPARRGAVELRVASLRQTRRAESLRVTVLQGEVAVLEAAVWMVDDLVGVDHDAAQSPEAPNYSAVQPWENYCPAERCRFRSGATSTSGPSGQSRLIGPVRVIRASSRGCACGRVRI
jgi:Thioesterase-like superfamily